MSDFYNKYPYTDFHELNLDWVIERVKKLTEDWAATLEEWNSTEEQWQELYNYVHDYFDNLDVQEEINNKINAMIADGTFVTITTPVIEAKVASMMPATVASQIGDTVASQIGATVASQIGDTVASQISGAVISPVTDWLEHNITQPTTPAVDNSLSISGAAADAASTGNTARLLKMICDGYNHFDASLFGRGRWQGGAYIADRPYRVATLNTIVYPFDLTITAATGFEFYIIIGGTYYGWITTYNIPAHSPFALEIKRTTEDTSETADVDEFISALTFENMLKTNDEILSLTENVVFDGKSSYNSALFGNGRWSGGQYDPNNALYRVTTKQYIKALENYIIKAASGFEFYIIIKNGPAVGYISEYQITKDDYYALEIQRVNPDTSEIADVDEFVGSLSILSANMRNLPNAGQKIVFLGDSTIGLERGSTSVPNLVSNMSGATCYNFAMGGTRVLIPASHSGTGWQYFDFKELATAIANNDYTNQAAHASDTGIPNYFAGIITDMTALDFSTIDIICMNYGANDYNDGAYVSDFIDQYKQSIEEIWAAYPNLRFMLITPSWYFWYVGGVYAYDCDTKTFNDRNETLPDFITGLKDTLRTDLHVPLSDVYYNSSIGKYNIDLWFIQNDHAHPNATGRKMLAKIISNSLTDLA